MSAAQPRTLPRARVLVVAGSDSSGGAGIDADRAALRAAGCELSAVVSAWTRQAEGGLIDLGARPVRDWFEEALAALREFAPRAAGAAGTRRSLGAPLASTRASAPVPIGALKFGLLPGAEHMRAAEELVARARALAPGLPVVLDPVLAPSSGGRFLDRAGFEALREWMARCAMTTTPNLPEARELAGAAGDELPDGARPSLASVQRPGREPGRLDASQPGASSLDPSRPDASREGSQASRAAAAHARRLLAALPSAPGGSVLLKDGHGRLATVTDLLRLPTGELVELSHARLAGPGLRGSGCRLASFLAARLAAGLELQPAARAAVDFLAASIEAARRP